jgi:hypothetical protein
MSLPLFQLSDGRVLRHTLDGRAFGHYMFRSTFAEKIPLISAPTGQFAIRWYRESNFGPGSALLPALMLALPFLRRSAVFPALIFGRVAMTAASMSPGPPTVSGSTDRFGAATRAAIEVEKEVSYVVAGRNSYEN